MRRADDGSIGLAFEIVQRVGIDHGRHRAPREDLRDKPLAYIDTALREVLACLAEGIDVRGYLYWSLLDNFEWALGYAPTFGLVAVDRQNFTRHPRPSASWLGTVARARALSGVAESV